MNFSLNRFTPPGNGETEIDCIVISQNSKVAVIAPRLQQPNGRCFKAPHFLEVDASNSLSPEYYDLSLINTIDTNRISAKSRGSLRPNDAKRLEFYLRSILAPKFPKDQTTHSGLIATYKFDEKDNKNTFNKKRPVFVIKTWENGMALVLPITSSTIKNNYRKLLPIGQLGSLKKQSSIALDHWHSVHLNDLNLQSSRPLPLLATLLTQARCQRNWIA